MSVIYSAAHEMREIKRLELHVKCPTLLPGMNKNGICTKILVNFQSELRDTPYLLNARSRVLLEKLTVPLLVKKFAAFY